MGFLPATAVEQVDRSSSAELNELAEAFDTLSVSLRVSRDRLKDLVAQRTAELRTAAGTQFAPTVVAAAHAIGPLHAAA